MKRVVLTICCLMLVGGCQAIITQIDKPYHELAWYQKGRSIPQARRACDECIYEVSKTVNPSITLFWQCMNLRGYHLYKAADLKANQIPIQQVPGWNSVFMHNDVSDGTSQQKVEKNDS